MADDPHDDDDLAPPEGDGGAHAHDEGEDSFAGLNHRQSQAIIALMSEPSIERAALKAGINERTLRRWMDVPDFQCAYRAARRQTFNQAIGLVVKYATLAVSTLVQTMADKDASHHAKVAAATAILKFGREGIELDDLAGRIEAIESSLNTNTPKGRMNGVTKNGWRH